MVLMTTLALTLMTACGEKEADHPQSVDVKGSGCADVTAPNPKPDGGATQPTARLDAPKTNTITFTTTCGDYTVTLAVNGAPSTTASVAALARTGFYDKTIFHRIVPGFVIQGGDPTGTGTGGPGYKTVDKPPSDAGYTRGVVAMAKTQDEAPGTAGSQFYVVTAADSGLPPEYAIIGKVTKGMNTVKRIEALGTASEQPQRPVVIKKATFSAQ
jgi:cyclophilin family peptidyl-prolyl cis-trans isomerase